MKRRRAPPAVTATSPSPSMYGHCPTLSLATCRRQRQTVAEQAGRCILIVENNPTALKLFRLALEAEGYVVRCAADAHSALERAVEQPPDLVLQDLMLPDM